MLFGLELTPAEIEAFRLSLEVSLAATALVAVPGIGLGLLLARCRFPGKLLLDAIVHLPLVLTPVVVGVLLLTVFGRRELFGEGFAFTRGAAILAAATVALPLVVRSVRRRELVDERLVEAAAVLGASPLRRLFTVVIPLASPGVIAGLTLGFARSLGEFGATITFAGNIAGETRTLPVAIYTAIQSPDGDGAALRMTALSVLVSLVSLGLSELLLRRMRARALRERGGLGEPRPRTLLLPGRGPTRRRDRRALGGRGARRVRPLRRGEVQLARGPRGPARGPVGARRGSR